MRTKCLSRRNRGATVRVPDQRRRQQLMRDEGPAFIAELMGELRVRHLGAPPKPHDGSDPLERPARPLDDRLSPPAGGWRID
jgi:hypothetical protein